MNSGGVAELAGRVRWGASGFDPYVGLRFVHLSSFEDKAFDSLARATGVPPLPRAIAPARDKRCSAACRSRRRADWSCCRRRQPRRYPGRRKPQRRDLDVVLGAGMGRSGPLPAFDHRRSPGGNWPFLGGVLGWLGHGRGFLSWKGPILLPLAMERYRRS